MDRYSPEYGPSKSMIVAEQASKKALAQQLCTIGEKQPGYEVGLADAYDSGASRALKKVRNLMRLGVHVQAAVAYGITSKGPWRSSETPGINQALSNAYLKSQGLYALRDGWIKLHHS